MKTSYLLLSLLLTTIFFSCTKEYDIIIKDETGNVIDTLITIVIDSNSFIPQVDFAYSVEFSEGYIRASSSDASSFIPNNSLYSWSYNGAFDTYYGTTTAAGSFPESGLFSISLSIITPDGYKFSKSHQFIVSDNIVTPFDYTTEGVSLSVEKPAIDFAYSLIVSTDYAAISFSDASNNVPNNSEYTWYVDGNWIEYTSMTLYGEGKHYIVLKVTTPDGMSYSKYKEFEVIFN